MEKPKIIEECPFCESGKIKLTTEKFKHIPKNKNYILEGDWYVYRCSTCKESFTTTESDTISQNNLKQKKL